MNKDMIEKLVADYEMFWDGLCPRCGRTMEQEKAMRALSRYADVSICSSCGMEEALQDFGDKENAGNLKVWQIYKELLEGVENREGRKYFISILRSGLYDGTNTAGESVLVGVEQGKGMVIKTIHANKPKWYEVVEYDEDGFQCGVSYEPTGD